MQKPLYSDLIDRAMVFAAVAHTDQTRKDPHLQIPYIAHPAMVASVLQRAGFEDDVIAAAILHDVVEDTERSLSDITRVFGARIANIVDYVSEADKSLPWEDRKRAYARRLAEAPPEAFAISMADKIHNLRSILTSAARFEADDEPVAAVWAVFKRGPQVKLAHYRKIHQLAAAREDLAGAPYRALTKALDDALNDVAALAKAHPPG